MSHSHYDVVIVGGGINGIGLLRDLSLHGVNALIIERGEFCSETSQYSSKMLHGGIRYLESLDFELVFEALREKNTWLKLLPQYAMRAKFHIPVYDHSPHNIVTTSLGSLLYGLLASGNDPIYLPISAKKTLELFPLLNADGLQGTARYEDAYMDDYGLGMANLQDALLQNPSNQAWAYSELRGMETKSTHEGTTYELTLAQKNSSQKIITAHSVIFCTGPFTDQMMNHLKIPWINCLRPSRGSHLWLDSKSLSLPHPMVMQDKSGRVIFLMPRGNKVLLGTTEKSIDPKNIDQEKFITQEETDYLLDCLRFYFPKINISTQDILAKYSGIRPLVVSRPEDNISSQSDVGKISRHHKIFEPLNNVFVLVGGKYTTFRVMVQDIAQTLCNRRKIPYSKKKTLNPLQGWGG
ncbi:MAG: FAD-dependent oxidoreductase [Bacteriovoracaceae bacterium]|nr:FAD-dependent oxidoreductase [Bacteriovoracaceae bacterium]